MSTTRARMCLLPLATTLACWPAFAQAPKGPEPLAGTAWRLVKFQGSDDATLTPDDGSKYTLEFGKDGGLSARIDCNRGRATWKVPAPGQIELGPLALTRAQCPPGSLHDGIVKRWSYVRSHVVKDGHLFLGLMADGGVYEFEPITGASPASPAASPAAESPAVSLDAGASAKVEGRVWRLTRLRGHTDKALAALPQPPTLKLEAGRLQGFGGCNRLVGSYTLDRDRVTFGPIAGTMMACPEPVMTIENALKAALAGTLTARVGPEGLTLTPASGSDPALVFVVEPQPVP
jgi:heat shock protein HslJ